MAMVKTISWPGVVNHHPRLRAPSSLPQNTGFTSRAVPRETSTCRKRGEFGSVLTGLHEISRSPPDHKRSAVRDKNRGHGSGIVVVDCLLILPSDGIQLLDYLWVHRFFHPFLGVRMFYGHRPAAGFLGSPVTVYVAGRSSANALRTPDCPKHQCYATNGTRRLA